MIEARKNSSACALTSDSIYVFGGTSMQLSSCDSIEVYSVATDSWTLLRIRLPNPVAFLLSFKVSETEIALLGGSVRELTKRSESYKTNQVLLFNALLPEFKRLPNMPKDVLSLYPPFYDQGTLYLIDEDGKSENPVVVRYDIDKALGKEQ